MSWLPRPKVNVRCKKGTGKLVNTQLIAGSGSEASFNGHFGFTADLTHLLLILDKLNRDFSHIGKSLELRLAEAFVHLHEPHKIVRHI